MNIDFLKRNFFFIAIVAMGVIFTLVSYYKYIYKQDYLIHFRLPCDPKKENCYVGDCDVEKVEECKKYFDVKEDGIAYYKVLERKAYNFPDCDFLNQPCPEILCPKGEKDCQIILCNKANIKAGEECSR